MTEKVLNSTIITNGHVFSLKSRSNALVRLYQDHSDCVDVQVIETGEIIKINKNDKDKELERVSVTKKLLVNNLDAKETEAPNPINLLDASDHKQIYKIIHDNGETSYIECNGNQMFYFYPNDKSLFSHKLMPFTYVDELQDICNSLNYELRFHL